MLTSTFFSIRFPRDGIRKGYFSASEFSCDIKKKYILQEKVVNTLVNPSSGKIISWLRSYH